MTRFDRTIQVQNPRAGDRYRWDGSATWYNDQLSTAPDGQPGFPAGSYLFFYDQQSYGEEYGCQAIVSATGVVHLGEPFKRDPTDRGADKTRIPAWRETTAIDAQTGDVVTAGGYRALALPQATDKALPVLADILPDGRLELRLGIDTTEAPEFAVQGYYEEALLTTEAPEFAVQGYYEEALLTTQAPLVAPTHLTAVEGVGNTGGLFWDDTNTTETAYRIERRQAGGDWLGLAVAPANATSQPLTNVPYGVVQEYQVRAERVIDGQTAVSDWSNVASLRLIQVTFSFGLFGQGNPPDKIADLSAGQRLQGPAQGNIGCTVRVTNGATPTTDDYDGVSFEVWFPDGSHGGFSGPQGVPQAGAYFVAPRPAGMPMPAGEYRVLFKLWKGGFVRGSIEQTFVLTGQGRRPAAPAGLNASAATNLLTRLEYSDTADNEDYFEVQYAPKATQDWQKAGIGVLGANVTRLNDLEVTPLPGTRFRVRAVNSFGTSDWSNVAVIADGNRAPIVAAVVNQTLKLGENYSFTLPEGSDPDGDALNYTLSPAVPGLSFYADSRLHYGRATQVGTTTLTYAVSDGKGGVTSRGYTLTVVNDNRPPVAPALADLVLYSHYNYGAPGGFQLPEGSDPAGRALSYALTDAPTGLSFSPDGRWLRGYVEAANAGVYHPLYRVTNSAGESATASATCTVLRSRITALQIALGAPDTADNFFVQANAVLPDFDGLVLEISRNGRVVQAQEFLVQPGKETYRWQSYPVTSSRATFSAGDVLTLRLYGGKASKAPANYSFFQQTITLPGHLSGWQTVFTQD